MIYLDNNSTTIMPEAVKAEMVKWMNKGNPSSDYKTAIECQKLMQDLRHFLADKCKYADYNYIEKMKDNGRAQGAYMANKKNKAVYQAVFTSGASESNCTIIRCVVDAYTIKYRCRPRVIISAVEHKSILECATLLAAQNKIFLTILKPKVNGQILAIDVEKAILGSAEQIALVCVMHANNETGAINDILEIGKVCRHHKVPFYSDCVQTFGKFTLDLSQMNIDAVGMSFHKVYGPPGSGLIIIRRQFIEELNIQPLIFGSQNAGFRGGTENIIALGGAFLALKLTWRDRARKNNQMSKLKTKLLKGLAKYITVISFDTYLKAKHVLKGKNQPFIVLLTGPNSMTDPNGPATDKRFVKYYLPNTVLLSLVRLGGKPFCNMKIRRLLAEKYKILVSAGSACNTNSEKASHVLYALGVDDDIKKGTIRISLSDNTNEGDVDTFVVAIIEYMAGVVKVPGPKMA